MWCANVIRVSKINECIFELNGESIITPHMVVSLMDLGEFVLILMYDEIIHRCLSDDAVRNIWCLDRTAKVRWVIDSPKLEDDYYCNFEMINKNLIVTTIRKQFYQIDINSGKII